MKNSLIYRLLVCFFVYIHVLPIEANEKTGLVIHSGEVQYEGGKIILVDNVQVEHSLGKIRTDHFSIESSEKSKNGKAPFSILNMTGNVFIELSGGGVLSCDKAEVDCENLKGVFLSCPGGSHVVYKNSSQEAFLDVSKPLFSLSGELMSMKLVREGDKSSKSRKTVAQDIEALHQVKVDYDKKYFLSADRAFYRRIAVNGQSDKAGVIIMSMDDENSFCLLTMAQDDYIKAKTIELDTIGQLLSLRNVKGRLSMQGEDKADDCRNFSADLVLWSDSDRFLHLIGNVCVVDGAGTVYSDEMHVNYEKQGKQMVPSKVVLNGAVRLFNRFTGHIKESGSVLHYALADRLEYFPEKREVLLTGNETDQVLFFDKINQVQMSAQSLRIIYDPSTKKESIQGIGHVRFTFMDRELDRIKNRFHIEDI